MAGTFVDLSLDGIYAVDAKGAIAKWAEGTQAVPSFRAYFKELAALDQHDDILLPGEAQTALQGDVNGDGIVSGADVTALYNKLLDNIDPAGNPDVNGDGVVSGADVTALYNLLLN